MDGGIMSNKRIAASDDKFTVLGIFGICLIIYFVAMSF
jgi:hypothetical protein